MKDAFEPALLVSMPQMQDPNFARAVVLLCAQTPLAGPSKYPASISAAWICRYRSGVGRD